MRLLPSEGYVPTAGQGPSLIGSSKGSPRRGHGGPHPRLAMAWARGATITGHNEKKKERKQKRKSKIEIFLKNYENYPRQLDAVT